MGQALKSFGAAPVVFQYAPAPVGTECLEGLGSVRLASIFALFLIIGKALYVRFVLPENGYPSGNLPLFEKMVVGANGTTCVRQEVRH